MTDKRDLLILGGGLVGMTLALAAAKKGLSSHLVDRAARVRALRHRRGRVVVALGTLDDVQAH